MFEMEVWEEEASMEEHEQIELVWVKEEDRGTDLEADCEVCRITIRIVVLIARIDHDTYCTGE